jgi:antitoxin Phd
MPRNKRADSAKAEVLTASGRWKLEDAKARFSEVVRRARDEGPQYVTVRGKPAVAIIDAAEFQRLLPADKPRLPFVQFMESLYVDGLDLERTEDRGRDVDL